MRLSISKIKASYEKPIDDFLTDTTIVYNHPPLDRLDFIKNNERILVVNYRTTLVCFNAPDIWYSFIKKILEGENVSWVFYKIDKSLKKHHHEIVKEVIDHMLSRYINIPKFKFNYENIVKLPNEPSKVGWHNNGGFRWEDIYD